MTLAKYCGQVLVPSDGQGWRNVGNLLISESDYSWTPRRDDSEKYPNIEVSYADFCAEKTPEQRVELFARFKLGKLAKELVDGSISRLPVVPAVLANEHCAPLFLIDVEG